MKQLITITLIGFCLNCISQKNDAKIVEYKGSWIKYENNVQYNYWTNEYDSSMYHEGYKFEITEIEPNK